MPVKKQSQKQPSKSSVWKQYKEMNLTGLTWRSTRDQMETQINMVNLLNLATLESYKNGKTPKIYTKQQKPKPIQQLPYTIEVTGELHPRPETQTDLLSEQLVEAFQGIAVQDFPVIWNYTDLDGEIHQYRANTEQALFSQFSALQNQSSDFKDISIKKNSLQFVKLQENYVPRAKIIHSKKGKGNDFKMCNVINDDFIYCPPSDKCLIDCLTIYKPKFDMVELVKYLKVVKVFRYNIPQCLVKDVAERIGVKYNIYRQELSRLRYPRQEGQIILCLIDSHWVVLKDQTNLKKCYDHAVEQIQWREKQVIECSLSVKACGVKYHQCPDEEQFQDTWIYDFEAFPDNITGKFIPYAVGFVKIQTIYDITNGKSLVKDPVNAVIQYDQSKGSCLMQMLRHINKVTKKQESTTQFESGVQMSQKRDIYLYAHNGANFDSYFFLDTQGLTIDNMVEKGGIMSMTVTAKEFQNCNFIVKDTRKFLVPSLKKLCESYKIEERYCKTEMDHNSVNASNWLALKNIWSPYLSLDVISLSLIWIKFIQDSRLASEKLDVKKYCSIAQLAYSIAIKGKKLPSVEDPKLREFIQRANRGGRVIARTQEFKTSRLDEILTLNKCRNLDEMVGKKLHPDTIKMIGSDYQIAFDATSLYPSAMSLPHASYLNTKKLKVLTPEECKNFNPKKYAKRKYIIECDLYAPSSLEFVPLSFKTKFGAQFSTGHIRKVVVNDVDLIECFRFGYILQEVYQGVWSRPVKYKYIKSFVEKYFKERALVKSQNPVLGDLYKLILNSSYGKFGQKRCDTEVVFTTECEMQRSYDENVLECQKLGNGQVCIKIKKEQQEDEKLSPHHIAGYILAYSKQIMNNFVLLLGADKENIIQYMDTDSFYIHSRDYAKLAHIKDELGGGKNDYGESKLIIKADYLGCKSKICYVLDTKTMKLTKKVTWKGISQSKFQEIGQETVERVKAIDEDTLERDGDYMGGLENWVKSKRNGVSIQYNCSKKLSIEEYCKKYDLVDGVYNFQHIE